MPSFLGRDQNPALLNESMESNHWTTKEFPYKIFVVVLLVVNTSEYLWGQVWSR